MSETTTKRGPFGSESQPKITTPCPACGNRSLFIGSGGHLTCAILRCPEPSAEQAIIALSHTAGAMAMAVLQDDLQDAKQHARNCKIAFDERGPYLRRWWPEPR